MEGTVPTNFENQDYPRPCVLATRLSRIGNDIDKMYSKDENCAYAYRLKTAVAIALISALFLGTLAVSSPLLLEFTPLAEGEKLEHED